MMVYVDDIVPISNDIETLIEDKNALSERFHMTDNGEISFILGMSIHRNRENSLLSIH